MNMMASTIEPVRGEVSELVADLFQFDGPITSGTSPNSIERWDSLQHVALIATLERTFSISLSMDEMAEIKSVGDIERILIRHGA